MIYVNSGIMVRRCAALLGPLQRFKNIKTTPSARVYSVQSGSNL